MVASSLYRDLDAFLMHLSYERRLSRQTIKAYQRDIKTFIYAMEQQSIMTGAMVRASHIRLWIGQLHRRGLSGRTIQRHLSAVRSLFGFLMIQGVVEDNPAQAVQAPKAAKRLPSTLDVDQINALLDSKVPQGFIACRDRAIMELLYSSGLRLSELANLNDRDVDFNDSLVCVTGKGNKQRVIPVGSKALFALKNWLVERESANNRINNALFTSQQGRRLGVRSIQKRLRHWGIVLGVSDTVHPHRLRHAFASHMLQASGDLRAVQELLGHADIATTQIYTHVDFQHLASVYDRAHPRAKKKPI